MIGSKHNLFRCALEAPLKVLVFGSQGEPWGWLADFERGSSQVLKLGRAGRVHKICNAKGISAN